MFSQIFAVCAMNIRSIPQRAGLSIATVLSVSLVVGVLLFFASIADGLRTTIQGSGSQDVAIMLRSGASQSELNSGLSREQLRLVEEAPGIARTAEGEPIISGELYVIADGLKRSSMTEANLPLRGVGQFAPDLRQNFVLVEGRMFEEGTNELLVGAGVLREFVGFELGSTIRLGNNEWLVVGVFSTAGSVAESELWADRPVIQNLFQRGTTIQSIRARLTVPGDISEVEAFDENEPRINLDIATESDFYAAQGGSAGQQIMALGWWLSIVMGLGAMAGAWNTMYSSVDSRIQEIATLRAIGFGGFPAAIGTLLESLVLAAVGGLIGAAAAYLVLTGWSASTLGAGFTQIVFTFTVTPTAILNGVLLALGIGLVGGIIPAIRSAYIPLLAVHRS